jgi:gluconate 2-dehydrogenase gamma chain
MGVLYVASEVFAPVKTRELADVSAQLPAASNEPNVDTRLLRPGYRQAMSRAVGLQKAARQIGISPSRRSFLRRAITAVTAAVAVGHEMAHPASAFSAPSLPVQAYTPTYFSTREWVLLGALVDRLIPADAEGPGALEAGVPEFIDRQMNEPYGHGALWYMHGPFREAPQEFGYQLNFTPRELYRAALPALDAAVRSARGKAFAELNNAVKDEVLGQLQRGELGIGVMPSPAFFAQLLQNTREGYFCDPVHGGNRNMASWRMINFPGARGDYIDWVEQNGRKYPFPPISVGATKG